MRLPTPTTARSLVVTAAPLLLVLVFSACSDTEPTQSSAADAASEPQTARKGATTRLAVLSTLGFTRMQADGKVPGFNLDGKVSGKNDPQTCNKPDFTSPDGIKGIDNRFATLVPAIEQSGLGAVEGLLQNAVDDGGLLIMLQLDGVDSLVNDPEIALRVRAGTGTPLLGTDGVVLAGQTFHLHPESPESKSPTAHIKDGILHAGPFDARLPLTVFGVHYGFEIKGARIIAKIDSRGDMVDGLFGGGLLVEDLIGIAVKAERFEKGVESLVTPLAKSSADITLLKSGHCEQISMALKFTGVSAFLWD